VRRKRPRARSSRRASRLNRRNDVAEALRTHYEIEATNLEPTERGKDFDASVFRVWVGEPKPRYIVKVRPANAPRDVAAAVARYVADAGVPGIAAPIQSLSSAISGQSGAWSLTVYPFIDGRHGIHMKTSDELWRAFGSFAKRLHATTLPPELAAALPHETYVPPNFDMIARVDVRVRESLGDDATSRRVGEFWRSHRNVILALASRAKLLGESLRQRSLPFVTCHADMHTGNVIIDDSGGLWVIDWDEAVLAPKERDLMFAVGGGISTALVSPNATARFLEGYGATEIDEPALAYYRHSWAVQDVGGYAWRVILDASATPKQRNDAARIFVGLFGPGEIVDLAARSA
jgi:spectinomycin phosphotransferase